MAMRSLTRARFAAGWSMLTRACLAFLIGIATAHATEEGFQIRTATLAPSVGVLSLDAQLHITLPDGARRAILDGVAMTLRLDFEVQRARRWWLDETVASLEQNYQVVYHALSQNFLLRNLNSGEQAAYGSLDAVLEALSQIRDLPALDQSLLNPSQRYEARLRASLDVRTLPDTLRMVLFWTDDWRQRTDWYVWSIQQ